MRKILFSVLVFLFMFSNVVFARSPLWTDTQYFPDVPEAHDNFKAIGWLYASGVVQGYSDGTFRPDNQINRAEFLKMLYEVLWSHNDYVGPNFGPTDDPDLHPFPDVPESEWFVDYVLEAYWMGVVNGYPDGTFRPGNNINFAEAVKIVMNGFFDVDALYGDGQDYMPCDEDLTDYDSVDTDDWYWKYLYVADELCILDFSHAANYGNGYNPSANISRADMAELLFRAQTLKDNEELTIYNDEYLPYTIEEDKVFVDDDDEDEMMDSGPLSLTSSVFINNGMIDAMYTCDGADVSPPLSIAGVPGAAVGLALILDDPDAPSGSWTHWLVWNIDPDTTMLEGGGISNGLPSSAVEGTSGSNIVGYEGPCPPLEDGAHHYNFMLYALDTELDLASGSTKAQLEAEMEGHILDTVQLTGLYDSN